MHVLMLGWEFPPIITGGLGTACHGLTKAMDRRGLKVTFVLPKAGGAEQAQHVDILGPENAPLTPETRAAIETGTGMWIPVPGQKVPTPGQRIPGETYEHMQFIDVESGFVHPYETRPDAGGIGEWRTETREGRPAVDIPPGVSVVGGGSEFQHQPVGEASHAGTKSESGPTGDDYGGDMMAVVERYARFCLAATRRLNFDVIHAHDWMTYPAGMMVARLTGKPLVVHVHSTEFDRSGVNVNQRIYDIERRGMHAASRAITVSQWTKNICINRYGVPDHHVQVVYNGVDFEPTQNDLSRGIRQRDKIVLYFGRITMQKGPEYFIAAAKRVLEVMDNVKFVVAGSGDMARQMIEMAANLGIGHKVLFTGFLRGDDIKRVFSLADLYVMPSVSEPFGIAPLEAISHDVPALISKTSGVSEVLSHALKADFWDIDDMANKIVAVLRHPPLSQTLREHGAFEVRGITWDGAARCCEEVYQAAINEMNAPPVAHV